MRGSEFRNAIWELASESKCFISMLLFELKLRNSKNTTHICEYTTSYYM